MDAIKSTQSSFKPPSNTKHLNSQLSFDFSQCSLKYCIAHFLSWHKKLITQLTNSPRTQPMCFWRVQTPRLHCVSCYTCTLFKHLLCHSSRWRKKKEADTSTKPLLTQMENWIIEIMERKYSFQLYHNIKLKISISLFYTRSLFFFFFFSPCLS